jgi:hypothetical protein
MAGAQKGLLELADLVGRAVADGAGMADFRALGELVAHNGGGPELVSLLVAEARNPDHSRPRMVGFCVILTVVLDELRLSANGGSTSAAQDLRRLRIETAERMTSEGIGEGPRLMVARAYVDAGLEPPRSLQEAIASALGDGEGSRPSTGATGSGERFFSELARELGGDPFRIHAEVSAHAAVLPPERRSPLIATLLSSDEASVREAAVGFLLDPVDSLALAVGERLADLAPRRPVESLTIARLGRMRPWLRANRQAALDQLLLLCRRHSGPPTAPPAAVCDRFFATPVDGAGAQSLFVVVRSSRKWALCSLLLKAQVGVADAWVASNILRADIDDMVASVREDADACKVSRSYVEDRLSHALRINQLAAPPPFALIQVLETMGAGVIGPQSMSPGELSERLLMDLPAAQTDEAALRRADAASTTWEERLPTIETWFEAGADIEAELLPLKSAARRRKALLESALPARRDRWMEILAWSAAALKDADPRQSLWRELALVSRALARGEEMTGLVSMQEIARRTLSSLAGPRGDRRR